MATSDLAGWVLTTAFWLFLLGCVLSLVDLVRTRVVIRGKKILYPNFRVHHGTTLPLVVGCGSYVLPKTWSLNRNAYITKIDVETNLTWVSIVQYTGDRWEIIGEPLDAKTRDKITADFLQDIRDEISSIATTPER
jgi:hypothetical protein